jgi:hypothetical protein
MMAEGGFTDKVTGMSMVLPVPVMVTVPEYVPGSSEPGEAIIVSEAGEEGAAVPLEGETLSQDPLPAVTAAVKDKEPLPVFKTCNCWVRGALGCVALKLRFCLSTPSAAGVPGCIASVTETVAVDGTALAAVMVTVP